MKNYSVGVCVSSTEVDSKAILNGLENSLLQYEKTDKIHFNLNIKTASNQSEAQSICSQFITENVDLIFTIGDSSLSAALIISSDTPIVMTGVMDYSNYVYNTSDNEEIRKFTGVSSLPNTEFLLSTLIESTDKLEAVGLFYSVGNPNSIYQVEQLESFLDQAKIPWKEYELPTINETETTSNQDIENLIPQRIPYIASSKEGAMFDIESFVEDNVLGDINAPKIARVPKSSRYWTQNPNIISENENIEESSDTEFENNDQNQDSDIEAVANPTIDTIEAASKECSILFIPDDNTLNQTAALISETALPQGTYTISNNINTGASTLLSTYSDPYKQGYLAGNQIYEILFNKTPVEDIPIGSVQWKDSYKVYNRSYINMAAHSFPKSFYELNSIKIIAKAH